MATKLRFGGLWAMALLCAACGSSEDGSPGGSAGDEGWSAPSGPGQPMTLEDFCTAQAASEGAWCEYLSKCCTAADQEAAFLPPYCIAGPGAPSDCIETFSTLATEGGIHFDGTWAESCLSEIAGTIPAAPAVCGGLHKGDYLRTGHAKLSEVRMSSCRRMLAGARSLGEACSFEDSTNAQPMAPPRRPAPPPPPPFFP